MTHKCPSPSCDAQVADELFACRRHWFFLPMQLRRRIWATVGTFGDERADAVDACIDYYVAHPDPRATTADQPTRRKT